MRKRVSNPVSNCIYCLFSLLLVLASPAFGSCTPALSQADLGDKWRLTDQIAYADQRLGHALEFHQQNSKLTLYSFDLGLTADKQPKLGPLFTASERALGTEMKKLSPKVNVLEPWQVPAEFFASSRLLTFASVTPLVTAKQSNLAFLGMGKRGNCIIKVRLTSRVQKIDRNNLLGFTSSAVKLASKIEQSLVLN